MTAKSILKLGKEYLLLTLGILIYVAGWTIFMIPNNLIGGVNKRKQPFSSHKLSGTRKQKRQTRRVDKSHGLAIDDNTAHAPVD